MWNEQKSLENLKLISDKRYLSQKLGSDIFTSKTNSVGFEGQDFHVIYKGCLFSEEGLVAPKKE